jgi:hypothetical protein
VNGLPHRVPRPRVRLARVNLLARPDRAPRGRTLDGTGRDRSDGRFHHWRRRNLAHPRLLHPGEVPDRLRGERRGCVKGLCVAAHTVARFVHFLALRPLLVHT